MKVMVLSAISRPDSSRHLLAQLVAGTAARHGVEVDFVTPAEAGLPVNDGTLPWDHPATVAWARRVDDMHARLSISPEYHSGMTGAMKNMLDHLAKEPMLGDGVGLFALAGGAMAALNTLNNMTVVARSLGAWVAPRLRGRELGRGEGRAGGAGPFPHRLLCHPGHRRDPAVPARGRRSHGRPTHGVKQHE
ncbi:MAG: NADPH-dependent FMN reductase [Acidimicrobiales bacterium]